MFLKYSYWKAWLGTTASQGRKFQFTWGGAGWVERVWCVSVPANEVVRIAAEWATAGASGRSPQWGPGAEPRWGVGGIWRG